jgi:hypothetical protein
MVVEVEYERDTAHVVEVEEVGDAVVGASVVVFDGETGSAGVAQFFVTASPA